MFSFCWFSLELVSLFNLRQFVRWFLTNTWLTFEISIHSFSSCHFDKLGFLFAIKIFYAIVSCTFLCKFQRTIIIIKHYRVSKNFPCWILFFFLSSNQYFLDMFCNSFLIIKQLFLSKDFCSSYVFIPSIPNQRCSIHSFYLFSFSFNNLVIKYTSNIFFKEVVYLIFKIVRNQNKSLQDMFLNVVS